MRSIGRKVAAVLFVAFCLLGGQVASAAPLKSISGAVVSSVNGKPIPALVYFKGKNVFANKTTGAFTLSGNPLASLSVGQKLSLRVFATGYAPIYKVLTVTSKHLTSGKITGLKFSMKPVAARKLLKVTHAFKAGTKEGYFVVSGTVKDGTTPVCAVVWANDRSMLACQTGAKGKFSLKGKLRASGKVTLKVFPLSSTYRTYSYTTPDTDKDGTADFMDRDDDNDGIEDGLDECPLDSNPDCLEPSVKLYAKGFGGFFYAFEELSFPYSSSGVYQANISGIPMPTKTSLGTFKLLARGKNYTIINLRSNDSTNQVTPYFTAISNNYTLVSGRAVTFDLMSPLTRGVTVNLNFHFEIQETGETFSVSYMFTSN